MGNIDKIVTPGNPASSSGIATTFNYLTDSSYNISGTAGTTSLTTPILGEPLTATDNLASGYQNVWHYRWDSQGRLIIEIDPYGNRYDYAYDIAGDLLTETYPATGQTGSGRAYREYYYLYPDGPMTSYSDYDEGDSGGAAVRTVAYTYGPEGELLAVAGSTEPAAYSYDQLYRITGIKDGNNNLTAYSYTSAGFPYQISYPLNGGSSAGSFDTITFTSYDGDGNLLVSEDGRGVITTYTRSSTDAFVTGIAYSSLPSYVSSLSSTSFTYDGFGRRLTMTDATGVTDYGSTGTEYGYDDLDNPLNIITTYTGLSADTLTYTYNNDGSENTLTVSGLSTPFSNGYDADGRLTSVTNPYSEATSWTYPTQPTTTWLITQLDKNAGGSNVLQTNYQYNPRGFLTDLKNQNKTGSGSLISEFGSSGSSGNMIYDAVGNLYTRPTSIPKFSSTAWTDSFTNDNLDELTSEATTGDGPANSYTYDSALNPTKFRGTTVPTADNDNQIAITGTNVFDGDGNPTTYESASFGFDPEDRLTGIGASFLAGYDGDGLRSWKNAGGSSAKTYFIYDGETPIVELDSTGSIAAVNTYGELGLISRHTVSTNKSVFYSFDPEGSVNAIEGSGGTISSTLLYDAFGDLIHSTGSGAQAPFGFGGQWGYYTDAESGLQLLTHRYYDAGAGRFINKDPIGQDGGINLYAYTANGPVGMIDPEGTDDSSYWSQVGQVFRGYGSAVNPINIANGVAQISQVAGSQGFGAAGQALANGVYHTYTDWATTSDPQTFGQSFGTVLLTAAPLIKRIPSPLATTIEGPYGKLASFTIISIARREGTPKPKCIFRIDVGKLPDSSDPRGPKIPKALRGRTMPHWHQRGSGGIGRHRPWEGLKPR